MLRYLSTLHLVFPIISVITGCSIYYWISENIETKENVVIELKHAFIQRVFDYS